MTTEQEIAERKRTIATMRLMLAALEAALADQPAGGAQDHKTVTGLAAIPHYGRLPAR